MNIYELCAKPPLELTDAEIEQMVEFLRQKRKDYLQAEAAGRSRRTAAQQATTEELEALFKDVRF